MVVRAGRVEVLRGTTGFEREMAKSVDPEAAGRYHSERPRSRQLSARSTA